MVHEIYNPFGVSLFAIHDFVVVLTDAPNTVNIEAGILLSDKLAFYFSSVDEQVFGLLDDLYFKEFVGL